jgi:hypothetical protein
MDISNQITESTRPKERAFGGKLAQSAQRGYNLPMAHPSSAWDHMLHLVEAAWGPQDSYRFASIPWPDVIHLARSEGVAPLLYAAVHRLALPLPADARAILEAAHYRTLVADTYRTQELEPVLAALHASGVPVLLLKGAALAQTVYKEIALRTTGDLDLAVPAEQVGTCRQILGELGYRPIEVELTPGAQLAYRNELAFSHGEPGWAMLELHWHLLDLPYYIRTVPMDWFWEDTDSVVVGEQRVQILSPEANMLYLPAHLALHHRFHGLRWFVDLALLVHKHQATLDWDKIITAAQDFRLLLVLKETLDRLAGFWPSLPLDGPRRRLQGMRPTPFEQRLFRLLIAEPRRPFLDFYTDVVCLPTTEDRARFVLQNIFPQQAYMLQRYSIIKVDGVKRTWELPYWYLYRLGDGLAKAVRTLPQVLRLR